VNLVFADAHAHSNPIEGLGAEHIAKRFSKVNGWFMALVMLPPWHYGLRSIKSLDDYRRAIEMHISECKRAREYLKVACFAGFHPAEVDGLIASGLSSVQVLELGLKVVEYVATLCRQGVLDGIGEVGRQHYKDTPERFAISYTIAQHALIKARDYGCLVHLHLENAGPVTVDTIDHYVNVVKAPRAKILFHHSSVRVAKRAGELGYASTIAGKKELLRAAFTRIGPVFMPESDFIDDPKRPCVSTCPWDMIENQKELVREGVVNEEAVWRVNVDNVVKYYGYSPP
jgi:TatD-related deoxyribonuclease